MALKVTISLIWKVNFTDFQSVIDPGYKCLTHLLNDNTIGRDSCLKVVGISNPWEWLSCIFCPLERLNGFVSRFSPTIDVFWNLSFCDMSDRWYWVATSSKCGKNCEVVFYSCSRINDLLLLTVCTNREVGLVYLYRCTLLNMHNGPRVVVSENWVILAHKCSCDFALRISVPVI